MVQQSVIPRAIFRFSDHHRRELERALTNPRQPWGAKGRSSQEHVAAVAEIIKKLETLAGSRAGSIVDPPNDEFSQECARYEAKRKRTRAQIEKFAVACQRLKKVYRGLDPDLRLCVDHDSLHAYFDKEIEIADPPPYGDYLDRLRERIMRKQLPAIRRPGRPMDARRKGSIVQVARILLASGVPLTVYANGILARSVTVVLEAAGKITPGGEVDVKDTLSKVELIETIVMELLRDIGDDARSA